MPFKVDVSKFWNERRHLVVNSKKELGGEEDENNGEVSKLRWA